jgi:hypothetical protein
MRRAVVRLRDGFDDREPGAAPVCRARSGPAAEALEGSIDERGVRNRSRRRIRAARSSCSAPRTRGRRRRCRDAARCRPCSRAPLEAKPVRLHDRGGPSSERARRRRSFAMRPSRSASPGNGAFSTPAIRRRLVRLAPRRADCGLRGTARRGRPAFGRSPASWASRGLREAAPLTLWIQSTGLK